MCFCVWRKKTSSIYAIIDNNKKRPKIKSNQILLTYLYYIRSLKTIRIYIDNNKKYNSWMDYWRINNIYLFFSRLFGGVN